MQACVCLRVICGDFLHEEGRGLSESSQAFFVPCHNRFVFIFFSREIFCFYFFARMYGKREKNQFVSEWCEVNDAMLGAIFPSSLARKMKNCF